MFVFFEWNFESKSSVFAPLIICKDKDFTGEGAYSGSVKVQTGPEMIILIALIMASGIAFILIRRGYLD